MKIAFALTLAAAAFYFYYWLDRCVRCGSVRGQERTTPQLVPPDSYRVHARCRRCGHAWERIQRRARG